MPGQKRYRCCAQRVETVLRHGLRHPRKMPPEHCANYQRSTQQNVWTLPNFDSLDLADVADRSVNFQCMSQSACSCRRAGQQAAADETSSEVPKPLHSWRAFCSSATTVVSCRSGCGRRHDAFSCVGVQSGAAHVWEAHLGGWRCAAVAIATSAGRGHAASVAPSRQQFLAGVHVLNAMAVRVRRRL